MRTQRSRPASQGPAVGRQKADGPTEAQAAESAAVLDTVNTFDDETLTRAARLAAAIPHDRLPLGTVSGDTHAVNFIRWVSGCRQRSYAAGHIKGLNELRHLDGLPLLEGRPLQQVVAGALTAPLHDQPDPARAARLREGWTLLTGLLEQTADNPALTETIVALAGSWDGPVDRMVEAAVGLTPQGLR